MFLNIYLDKWHRIPSAVKQFLLKGLLVLFVWKVIYLGFLFPGRVLDSPVTHAVGVLTANGLNWVTRSDDYWTKGELGNETDTVLKDKKVMQQSVYFQNKKLVGIYDACNALELFVLYAGFIVCMSASLKRKLIFIAGGIAFIFLVNILRCIGVSYIVQYHPQQADFVHHYVFVFVVYASIISMWLIFVSNTKVKSNDR
jgi:exosortase family protein XrtF